MSYQSVWNKLKQIKKDQLLIILLVGVLLLVVSIPVGKEEEDHPQEVQEILPDGAEEETTESYERKLEARLEKALSAVDGVGRAKVMITVEGSGETEVLKDIPMVRNTSTEADSAGGTRTTMELETTESTVYTTDEAGNQVPYVRQEKEPAIRGILVVAEGGADPVTVSRITDAVEALFQVEPHRIKVMKMKIQG